MFIDTHCHLNDRAFQQDLGEILELARQRGVKRFIIPGADPSELDLAIRIAQQQEGVYFAVGIHPYDLDKGYLKDYREFLKHPKCVAVGECGLDYYHLTKEDQNHKDRQKAVFREHIELALEYDLPLILHVREASADVAEILRQYRGAYGVFHCFNADAILLAFQESFYYGIGGVCTFKNARRLVEILPRIPKERLLLETDAPYLAPAPHRGERNQSAFIPIIAEKMAEILALNLGDLKAMTTKNAQRLFRFDEEK